MERVLRRFSCVCGFGDEIGLSIQTLEESASQVLKKIMIPTTAENLGSLEEKQVMYFVTIVNEISGFTSNTLMERITMESECARFQSNSGTSSKLRKYVDYIMTQNGLYCTRLNVMRAFYLIRWLKNQRLLTGPKENIVHCILPIVFAITGTADTDCHMMLHLVVALCKWHIGEKNIKIRLPSASTVWSRYRPTPVGDEDGMVVLSDEDEYSCPICLYCLLQVPCPKKASRRKSSNQQRRKKVPRARKIN